MARRLRKGSAPFRKEDDVLNTATLADRPIAPAMPAIPCIPPYAPGTPGMPGMPGFGGGSKKSKGKMAKAQKPAKGKSRSGNPAKRAALESGEVQLLNGSRVYLVGGRFESAGRLSLTGAAKLTGADHLALEAGQDLLFERARAELPDTVDDVLRIRVHELLRHVGSALRGLLQIRLVGLRSLWRLLKGLLLETGELGDARALIERHRPVCDGLLVGQDVHRVVRVPVGQHDLLRRRDGYGLGRFAFGQEVQK